MTAGRRWLSGRSAGVPGALRHTMEAALEGREGPATESLAGAGLDLLVQVVAGEGDRNSALSLLAADGLLTYACEAAAEDGPEALEAVTTSLDIARFESLLAAGGA